MIRYFSVLLVSLFSVAVIPGGIAGCSDVDDNGEGHNVCEAESDEEFCKRIGSECGTLVAEDNCGDQRTVGCKVDCPSCDGVEVSLADDDGGSFAVDSTEVQEDGEVELSWAAAGGCGCSGFVQEGDWPGWDDFEGGAEGNTSVSVSELEPGTEHTACIECCNGQNCDDRCAQFTVVEDDNGSEDPIECDDRKPDQFSRRFDDCGGHGESCEKWEGFWNREFGAEGSNTQTIRLEPDHYLALRFESGEFPGDMKQRIDSEGGPVPSHQVLTTISKCPGDFHRDAIEAEMQGDCYLKRSSNRYHRWQGVDVTDDDRCVIEQNETYYLNILHTEDEAGTPPEELEPSCPWPECGGLLWIQ